MVIGVIFIVFGLVQQDDDVGVMYGGVVFFYINCMIYIFVFYYNNCVSKLGKWVVIYIGKQSLDFKICIEW